MRPLPSSPLIAYRPYFDTTVEKGYTLRMREALGLLGHVVRFDGFVATWRAHHRRLDAIVLNWTDNDLLDRRRRRVAWRKVVKVFAKTIALRLSARRLVFVRHNVYPHATAAGYEVETARWIDRYERLFDTVLVHSGDERHRSRLYCPHPLYRVVDAPVPTAFQHSLPARYFVVFGRIVRYKQIDRLMAAMPSHETLVVIGAVGDAGYAAELAAMAGPNVIVRAGLIDEAEAQSIVAQSAALLIAHADDDVIVSASFFFAMSLDVPVIAVATPFLRWIAPRVGSALRVVDDLAALARAVDDRRDVGVVGGGRQAIEREFGDQAVEAACRRALGIEP